MSRGLDRRLRRLEKHYSKHPPAGIVIDGNIFLEVDQLLKKIKESRKEAVKSYEKFYRKRVQEWLDQGENVDIRAEQKNMRQTSNNIGMAIDTIIGCIENVKEQV